MLQQIWLPPLIRKPHSGIRVRRFAECILEEIALFPAARIGLRERIRVPIAADFSRQSKRTMTPYTAVRPSYPLSEVKAGVSWILLRGATDTIDTNSLRLEWKAASAILRSDLGFDRCRFLREVVSIWRQRLFTY